MKDMASPIREEPPQAENLTYWLRRFSDLRRDQERTKRELLAAQQRITLLEATQVLQGMGEYVQHPTEHRLREERP